MITLNVQLPESVAVEFYQATDERNQHYSDTMPWIDAESDDFRSKEALNKRLLPDSG